MNWKSTRLQERQALEQRIDAIIDRYNGVPYAHVLERRGLTPNQFYIAATHKLHDLMVYASEEKREVLEKILADDEKYRELFRMEEDFIRDQYLRVIGKLPWPQGPKQRRLPEGIFVHPENLELLAYCALTYHNPKLSSDKRAEVIQGVKELPADLRARSVCSVCRINADKSSWGIFSTSLSAISTL